MGSVLGKKDHGKTQGRPRCSGGRFCVRCLASKFLGAAIQRRPGRSAQRLEQCTCHAPQRDRPCDESELLGPIWNRKGEKRNPSDYGEANEPESCTAVIEEPRR